MTSREPRPYLHQESILFQKFMPIEQDQIYDNCVKYLSQL